MGREEVAMTRVAFGRLQLCLSLPHTIKTKSERERDASRDGKIRERHLKEKLIVSRKTNGYLSLSLF